MSDPVLPLFQGEEGKALSEVTMINYEPSMAQNQRGNGSLSEDLDESTHMSPLSLHVSPANGRNYWKVSGSR